MSQLNLPHQAPLIFAKKKINLTKDDAIVLCEFDTIPTLAMFIEASAQASSVFETDEIQTPKIGFLTKTKDIKLLCDIKEKSYNIHLKKEVEIGNIKQFSFEAFSEKSDIKVVSGSFTVLVQE